MHQEPWKQHQVRVVDSWPDRRDQRVSVALSLAGDRLARSVGQQLSVFGIADGNRTETLLEVTCALAPGLSWSPSGDELAFRGETGHGRFAELPASGAEPRVSTLGPASAMAFTPNGRLAVLAPSLPGRMTLAVVTRDRDEIWRVALTRNPKSSMHPEGANLAVSPDGRLLACTTGTHRVWVFETETGRRVREFDGHSKTVTGLDWIDDQWIVSAAADATLQVWHPEDLVSATVVETIPAAGMAFVRERRTALVWSARGELLAWSLDGTPPAQLWDREPPARNVGSHFTRLAVSAAGGLLALVDAGATDLILVSDWEHAVSGPAATTTYANAKVLLLGDSGVGKSGLSMVLAGKDFSATESTHGRQIFRLPAAEEPEPDSDNRDVLLWDLAGQPGYRIVHQLHLEGAALALILFDGKSEITPLAGVQHWVRAVRHAHPDGGLKTFLVAARTDRGGSNVSDQRIRKLMDDFSIDGYFKTSAKEGTNVDKLRSALLAALDWAKIPEVTSTALFAAVKQFVVDQISVGSLLAPLEELCQMFQATVPGQALLAGQQPQEQAGDGQQRMSPDRLISDFEGCIARLESAGLVKRLKYGNYVLLRPELLDAYAGAIVNAARDEPDGLGSIAETKVVSLDFPVPSTDRELEPQQERLLVLATLEELLRHELVLREPPDVSVQLVFPSAYRRDLPESESPRGDGIVFRFAGPVENIYATLIVRLTRSNTFTRVEAWQSAARFAADAGECTVVLHYDGEGTADLWIGYDEVPDEQRRQFEHFVHAHLKRQATPGSVIRERRYSCPHDGTAFDGEEATAFTAKQVEQVTRIGRPSIMCPVCEKRVPLRDDYQLVNGTDLVTAAMDASADAGREIAAAAAVVRGKEEVAEYDVFLSYNWRDKEPVRWIAQQLRDRGLRPWLDERQLRPGLPWPQKLEAIIAGIPAAAVIIGAQLGPWQNKEMYAFVQQSVSRGCAIVPVLLPDANAADVPVFLQGLTWVNLAISEPDPIDQLVWGITGQQPIPG